MSIQPAVPAQATAIARLIMQAMNYDCCQYFAGPNHTLADFEQMMTRLVAMDESQYSYRNTLVALSVDGEVAGICVTYDGGKLHRLRRAFVEAALSHFGRDFSDIADETTSGELYIDSLAVAVPFRHRGIATALLKAAIERGRQLQLPVVGLLVDRGNPRAEQLYRSLGFRFIEESSWGGHPMNHLQYFHHEEIAHSTMRNFTKNP